MVHDDHVWMMNVPPSAPAPATVDSEIVDVLGRDPVVWDVALAVLDVIESGGHPDLWTWPGAVAMLTEYRARGGTVQCPMDAVSVTVRALLAALAADLDAAAERVQGEAGEGLRDTLRAGAGRIRDALGG